MLFMRYSYYNEEDMERPGLFRRSPSEDELFCFMPTRPRGSVVACGLWYYKSILEQSGNTPSRELA